MNSLKGLVEKLEEIGCVVEPCGSRVTCNPAPLDTDQDFLVEIQTGDLAAVVDHLQDYSFICEGDGHYKDVSNTFMSWRNDEVNFIVTSDGTFAKRHRAATALCTRLNLMNKQDRIALFQAVLYGETWDGKNAIQQNCPNPQPLFTAGDDFPF